MSENHTLRSSQKNELCLRPIFSEGVLNVRLDPFLKISIHSCSKVTYAPQGNIPLPINLLGALVAFLHRILGRLLNPIFSQADIIRVLLLYRENSPFTVRVASPMLIHRNAPSFITLQHSAHTLSSSECISSKANLGLLASRAVVISGFCCPKTSSHISIIG